jgi:hypothetical protein
LRFEIISLLRHLCQLISGRGRDGSKTYLNATSYLEKNGFEEPDPAEYGVWVSGIPILVGNGLEVAGAWLVVH